MTRTCNACGKETPASRDSLPQGQYRCRACRRASWPKCVRCDRQFEPRKGQRFCSYGCWLDTPRERSVPTEWTQRTRRKYRERVTPGLTSRQLKALRDRWAGTPCTYCADPSDTIDHVIPISRGGTNHEGNLTPCCKRCNSTKGDLLLTEWRYGKPHGHTITRRAWMDQGFEPVDARRVAKPTPELTLILDTACRVCGQAFTPAGGRRRVFCGPPCSEEWNARVQRNAYRRKTGKPEDWTTPVKRRAA